MSLKNLVVCIAGDIRQDMFAPASWEDANIERWFKQRSMTLVWEDMNKSVTHLVISRAAFKSNHDAGKSRTLHHARKRITNAAFVGSVKYVRKDRRGKKKAKIVTYDWLEDCLSANKAIQNVSVYDPGKPRNVTSIVAASSKSSKIAKGSSSDDVDSQSIPAKKPASNKEGPAQVVEIRQKDQSHPKTPTSSTLEPSSKGKLEAVTMDKSSSSIVTHSSASKQQPDPNKLVSEKQPIPVSGSKDQTQKNIRPEKLQDKASPAVVSGVDVGLSWEAKNKPRVFCDKTDQFNYRIELVHKEKVGEKWRLMLLKAPNVIDRAYLFRAYQYNAKDKIDLKEDNTPPSTFLKAFELFKNSFRSKTRYAWDERLVRAGDVQPGKWRYQLPAKGKPTGKVPPEYDPGHPKYTQPKDLAPIVQPSSGESLTRRNVSEMSHKR